jgi:hypothetical protein
MPDEASEKAVDMLRALGKIERHQSRMEQLKVRPAPKLRCHCGKGSTRRQAGARVADKTLAQAESAKLALRQRRGDGRWESNHGGVVFGRWLKDGRNGQVGGIELYSRAASVGVLQDSVNTGRVEARLLRTRS